jgi:hypothetical protein
VGDPYPATKPGVGILCGDVISQSETLSTQTPFTPDNSDVILRAQILAKAPELLCCVYTDNVFYTFDETSFFYRGIKVNNCHLF